MRRYRACRRAMGLRAITRFEPSVRTVPTGALKHRIIEARSLAIHRVFAQKIESDPALLEQVRQTLHNWRQRYREDMPRALDEWDAILRRPWPEITAFIPDPGERATRLRQSTPFSGLLSASERERVFAAFRS